MKVKLLVLAVAMLALASLSFGQAGMCIYDFEYPLTKHCTGGGAIPINHPLWLMNDTDGDGWVSCLHPDPDPLATLCAVPYDCDTGPVGTLNRQFVLMGEGDAGAGLFGSDPCIMASGAYPPYGRFYLKVEYSETTVVGNVHHIFVTRWLSRVFVMPTSLDDIILGTSNDWTCCEWDTTWSTYVCVPDLYTQFTPVWPQGGQQHFHDCVQLCVGRPHLVSVGPLQSANRRPHGMVMPGCDSIQTPCDSICEPASGWNFGPLVWTLRTDQSGCWYDALILSGTEAHDGCACIFIDYIEAVEFGEVAVVPLNNSVKIRWQSLSEDANVAGYAIYRDGAPLTTMNAKGASWYEYVDTDLQNGRLYAYDLRLVDINSAQTSFHTASVTPSFENALVTEYALHQNYPNPFNPSTKIAFDVVGKKEVTVTVYNATGQLVRTMTGTHSGRSFVVFDSGSLTSGLYFYTVNIGNEFTATKKMLLVK